MKNIKLSVLLLCLTASLISITFTGCNKLTEVPQSSIAPQNFYNTLPQCESVLAAAMARLYSEWNDQSFGYPISYFRHDDVFAGDNNNISIGFGTPLWGSMWGAIVNCNELIKAINGGSLKGATDTEKELLIAQAKFIRAWNYFDLVRFWGGVPIYNELNEGAALNPLARASVADVYAQIVADFSFAAAKLPATRVDWSGDKRGRPTGEAAHGLLAKVYLTMATNPLNAIENYAKAKDEAKIVMESKYYKLTPKVEDVFLRENKYSPEMMWSLIANSVDKTSSVQIWDMNLGWGDCAIEPRMDTIWPAQPRKTAYMRTVNTAGQNYLQWSGTQTPFCRKFCDTNVTKEEYDSYTSYCNLPVIRYADVLLIYAEASNMASSSATVPQDAVDALNLIIDRANGGAGVVNSDARASRAITSMTKAQFDDRVIMERHFELFCEYNRWFDLIRKKLLSDTRFFPVYWGYKAKDSDYLWPLPVLDLQQNPLLVQNPGY